MKKAIRILTEIREATFNMEGPVGDWVKSKCVEALEDLDDEVLDETCLDIDAIFEKYEAKIVWEDTLVDGEGNKKPMPEHLCHWRLVEKYGSMDLCGCEEIADARLAGALFLYLWGEKGVPIAIAHRCAIANVRNYTVRPIDDDERERLKNALRPKEDKDE
jgi:hypothetical protein